MPLNFFYTMVQKSQKWPKTQIKGGPALNQARGRARALWSWMLESRFVQFLLQQTFEHCRKVKAAGHEQPVPELHVFPNKATRSRLSSLPLHLPRGLFFFFFATTNQARQLSFTVECVCVCIVCRVCVWGLFAQAEPSISESPRRGQNESYPLSPLGHRHYSAEWRLLQVFFFRESPWAGLQGILVNLGLSKGLLAATLTQCFWPTDKHDICSSFNWKRIDRVLLPWSSTPWLRPALIITTARKVKRAGTLQERTAKGMSQVVDQLGRNWFDRSSAVSTPRESCSMH